MSYGRLSEARQNISHPPSPRRADSVRRNDSSGVLQIALSPRSAAMRSGV